MKNIDRDNNKTKDMLRLLPDDLKFVSRSRDSLHRFLSLAGDSIMKADEYIEKLKNNLFLETSNPAEPYEAWVSGYPIPVYPDIDMSGYLAENMQDFLGNEITRIEYSESVSLSGITSGIVGCSYGFDWDNSEYYFTVSGSDLIYIYSGSLDIPYSTESYALSKQDYDTTGRDEYVDITKVGDNLYMGILDNAPTNGTLSVIDAVNLQDPNDPDSDGIEVDSTNYTVSGVHVWFTTPRSDYDYVASGTLRSEYIDPSTGELEYIYPSAYQPDTNYGSSYIAEYWFYSRGNPRFLTQRQSRSNLGLRGFPLATTKPENG